MDINEIGNVLREAVNVILKISAPILLLSMFVGVIMALVQAVTQVHEQSLNFIMKLVVVIGVLIIGGRWMLQMLQEFALGLFEMM